MVGPNTIDARVVDFAGNSAAAPAVTIERQESPVEGLAAAPPAIPHQVPTVVTFTLRLAAPALALVHAVDLERRDESGGLVATYGPMRDDGMSGDEEAGDTLQVSLLESGRRC